MFRFVNLFIDIDVGNNIFNYPYLQIYPQYLRELFIKYIFKVASASTLQQLQVVGAAPAAIYLQANYNFKISHRFMRTLICISAAPFYDTYDAPYLCKSIEYLFSKTSKNGE